MTNIPRKDSLFVDMVLPETLFQTASAEKRHFLTRVAEVLQLSKKH